MRIIDELSVKFVESGIVRDGEAYSTPSDPIPLEKLAVNAENGPFVPNVVTPVDFSGLSVNFVTRSIQGNIDMNETAFSRINSMLGDILRLHDALRKKGSVIRIKTGFSIESEAK